MLLHLPGCVEDEPCNAATPPELQEPDTDVDTTGLAGLELWCARLRECGGLNYATNESCVAATQTCWGTCSERTELLDAYGDCMAALECEEYDRYGDPHAHYPPDTPCAAEWEALNASSACRDGT